MNKIKGNKKLFVVIVIISLLAILLGSYAIYKNSNKEETTSKIEKSEKFEKKAEKKLKEAKKSGDKEEIAKAEKELKEAEQKTEEIKKDKTGNSSKANTPSASSSNANTSKSSSSTASKPSTSSSSGATSTSKPTPKPKEKQKVWIVDKPAWTETVQEPIYSERNVWYASNADNSKSAKLYSLEECNNWLTTVGEGMGGYQKTTEEYISGYNPKTITHPEQGHWEYR